MKRAGLSSPLRVAAATSVTLFSLVSLFSSTIAWFNSRRVLGNGGSGFEVQKLSLDFQSLTIYPCAATSRTDIYFDMGEDAYLEKLTLNESTGEMQSEKGIANLPMGEYTLLDPRHPLLMLIEYKQNITASSENKVLVTAKTNPADRIYLGEAATLQSQEIATKTYALSSVVRTYSTYYDDLIGESDLTSYRGQDHLLQFNINALEGNSFQHGDFAHFSHQNNIVTYIGFDNETNFFAAENGEDIRTVAVILDFHADSLEYIYNKHLGDKTLEEAIYFQCDWRMMI